MAPTRHGSVDGEDDGVVAGGACPIDELYAVAAISHEVELEPPACARHGRGEVLDGGRAERGQAVGDAQSLGHAGDGGLARRMHHPRESGGREDQRKCRGLAQDGRRRVHGADIAEHARLELHAREGPPGSAQARLVLPGRAIGVVEDGARHPTPGHGPDVRDARASLEQHLRAIQARTQVAHERLYVAPAREPSAHDAEPSIPAA